MPVPAPTAPLASAASRYRDLLPQLRKTGVALAAAASLTAAIRTRRIRLGRTPLSPLHIPSVADGAPKVLKLWPTFKHPCLAHPKAALMSGGSMP
jgi:hypothetical protein